MSFAPFINLAVMALEQYFGHLKPAKIFWPSILGEFDKLIVSLK
jgi:hypothetical protein